MPGDETTVRVGQVWGPVEGERWRFHVTRVTAHFVSYYATHPTFGRAPGESRMRIATLFSTCRLIEGGI